MSSTMTATDRAFDELLRQRLGALYMGWTGAKYAATIGGGFVPRPAGAAKRGYVVHHTAGTEKDTGENVWRFHTVSRGWATVGYHLFIRWDGRVELLVPPSWMSYSVSEHNPYWVAVCCAGDLEANEPPPAMLRSLYRVLCCCDDVLGDRPWRAHREVMPGHTACPGAHLFAHVQQMRGPKYGAKNVRPMDYV